MSDSKETDHGEVFECISFTVSGQVYCINIMSIREIRRWASVTTLPHSGAHVLGVINLRGSVIPVYDLAVHFGLGKTTPDSRNVVIIADMQGDCHGLLVESVFEILTVKKADVQAAPKMGNSQQSNLIEGLISIGDKMAQLINLNHISSNSKDSAA